MHVRLVALLCVHWPTARMESPVSVTVADADAEESSWLVAVMVTEVTELRGGTEMSIPDVTLPAVTDTVWGAGCVDTEVAAGAV